MRSLLAIAATVFALLATPALASVGFVTLKVPNPDGAPLELGVWYPSDAAAAPFSFGPMSQTVALKGPVTGHRLALIVMSHGSSGFYAEHYDTAMALAEAGFVVAAPTHAGDSFRDMSRVAHLADRPRQLQLVIDYMLTQWDGHAELDARKIGVFGFSSGGFGSLVLIGGTPDLSLIPPHCAAHPDFFDCQVTKKALGASAGNASPPPPPQTSVWVHDPRVKAAVIAVPALGFTFGKAGLRDVRIPVQLWRAGRDTTLPHPYYAQAVRDALPRSPEYHVVEGADHNDFLAPCSPMLAKMVPGICQEIGAFDRSAFHVEFNRDVVVFFKRQLGS